MAMSLREWAETYVRHRDLFKREIEQLEPTAEGFRILKRDGSSTTCIVQETLAPPPELAHTLIVTRNTKENVLTVLKEWKRFAAEPDCTLIFANVKKNEKWVLIPSTHDKVTESASLKSGLLAMHQAVPEG